MYCVSPPKNFNIENTPPKCNIQPTLPTVEQNKVITAICSVVETNGAVRLFNFKKQLIDSHLCCQNWDAMHAVSQINKYAPEIQAIPCYDRNIEIILFVNIKDALISIIKKNLKLQEEISKSNTRSTEISINNMEMLIKVVLKGKQDIVRYVVAKIGGEFARNYYKIHLLTDTLEKRIDSLCDG
jgi:hypothetical protein